MSPTQCPLLALPPELRNRIYDYHFYIPTPDNKINLTKTHNPTPSVLALLQTCRQIHNEALKIFYNLNHFRLEFTGAYDPTGNDLIPFNSLSSKRMESIEAITLRFRRSPSICAGALQAASTLPNLQILHLETTVGFGSGVSSPSDSSMLQKNVSGIRQLVNRKPGLREMKHLHDSQRAHFYSHEDLVLQNRALEFLVRCDGDGGYWMTDEEVWERASKYAMLTG